MGEEIKPKVELNLVNKNEGGCACQTLGIECTCGESQVYLYDEFEPIEMENNEENSF